MGIGEMVMTRKLEIISRCSLFKGLPKEQLEDIERISIRKHYDKDDEIFFEGDEGTGFYIVSDGTVKIYKMSMEAKEQILHILGPGELFGEVPVFAGNNFPANAQAITKCTVLYFPRKAFAGLISRSPSLAMNMLSVLSMRLREFTLQVENLSLKEVPGRLASYLLFLSRERNHDKTLTLTISKGQLASLLGTIPETLSRIFMKMSNHKLIEVDGRNIKLIDIDGLKELAKYGKILEPQ